MQMTEVVRALCVARRTSANACVCAGLSFFLFFIQRNGFGAVRRKPGRIWGPGLKPAEVVEGSCGAFLGAWEVLSAELCLNIELFLSETFFLSLEGTSSQLLSLHPRSPCTSRSRQFVPPGTADGPVGAVCFSYRRGVVLETSVEARCIAWLLRASAV